MTTPDATRCPSIRDTSVYRCSTYITDLAKTLALCTSKFEWYFTRVHKLKGKAPLQRTEILKMKNKKRELITTLHKFNACC